MSSPPAMSLISRFMTAAWPMSRVALTAGTVMTLIVALALAAAAWYEEQEFIHVRLSQAELLARVFDDHATRTIDTASLALAGLAEVIENRERALETAHLDATLSQSLVGLPFMRSLALVDLSGRVLASSARGDAGRTIDMRLLGNLPPVGREAIGTPVPGRQLADLSVAHGERSPAIVSFIPILRRVSAGARDDLLLIGLINPGALETYHKLALAETDAEVILASYDGWVMSSAGGTQVIGSDVSLHPVFGALIAGREHGSYIGPGFGSQQRMVAYRASRTRPLVIIVERSQAAVLAQWAATMHGFAVAAMLALMLTSGMTWIAWRSLHGREIAREALDLAQDRVARSERELSEVIASVQELIFRTDGDGLLTFVNDRWKDLAPPGAAGVLGRPLRELVDRGSQSAVDRLLASNGPSGPRSAQVTVKGDDGSVRRFDVTVTRLRDQPGFVGSAMEVTERWNTEQKLQQQVAFSGLLLEISPVPVSMTDDQGRYVVVNQAWESFTGCPRGEVIGRSATEVLPLAQPSIDAEQDARLLGLGGPVRYETEVTPRHRPRRHVVVTKVQVPGEDGQRRGILCTTLDVSEFREAERATREARDAAERASRAKSEFIAHISDELRSPLQSILRFAELGMARATSNDRKVPMLEDIHVLGERTLVLVNDLLDIVRFENHASPLRVERADLRGLIRNVVAELKLQAVQRQVDIETRWSDLPLVAWVDPVRFQQVMRNLLTNAIEFSPEGGRIDVIGDVTRSGDVHVRVRDQGPGIPENELESIFEPFGKPRVRGRRADGPGLGLALCRSIVSALGGRIAASRALEGGAEFLIELPARSSRRQPWQSANDCIK